MIKLPNLDALRFFLASMVIVFHIPLLSKNVGLPYFNEISIFNRGIEAVYMFFVLSGFLIIRLIYIEKNTGTFSIKKFYMRRILRIFPLYYLVLIFGFLFYHLILQIIGIPYQNNYPLKEGILLTLFFLPNIFAELYKPGGILEVLWSIGIEEQFYILIAPLLFLLQKKHILQVLTFIAMVYFFVFHLASFSFLKTYSFVYFYLLIGGMVAILEEKKKLEFLKSNKIFPISIVVLVVLYFFTDFLVFKNDILQNLITAILFSLFIHTISFNNWSFKIKNKLINYLGQISYGIYMYHIIILNFVVYIFIKINNKNILNDVLTILLINFLTFVFTIFVAHISFQYFEKPFLKLKNKFR
ncbi:acyltransferase family protein [Algibacter sp.]|uniref:acyltransferase family protein n=1 Tax=Algibacter sp. TaxID=1872428 RepID=UPI003C7894D3